MWEAFKFSALLGALGIGRIIDMSVLILIVSYLIDTDRDTTMDQDTEKFTDKDTEKETDKDMDTERKWTQTRTWN